MKNKEMKLKLEFRHLDKNETKEFKQWARDNYIPFSEINTVFHPIIQEECKKINIENKRKDI